MLIKNENILELANLSLKKNFIGKLDIEELENSFILRDNNSKIVIEKNEKYIFFINLINLIFSILNGKLNKDYLKEIENFIDNINIDYLTNLPNRKAFLIKLEEVIDYSKRNNKKFAVFFIDLDNFKKINDTVGHNAGDFVLQNVANRIKSVIRKYDFLARIGGDEFVLIVNDFKKKEDLATIAKKILFELEKNMFFDSILLEISASIGIAVFPENGENVDKLLSNADNSMYHIKSTTKGNFTFFDKKLQEEMNKNLWFENEFENAFQRNEFYLVFQPKIDISSNEIYSLEALIRWKHHQKGIIPNGEWIHIIERTRFIYNLTSFVLDTALTVKNELNLPVSINLTWNELDNDTFFDELDFYGVDYVNGLIIELLERCIVDDFKKLIEINQRLKNYKINLSLDDFGEGQTSLKYLSEIVPYEIKIDRSYVNNINDKKNLAIIENLVSFAKKFNINIVAEGVETIEQLNILKKLGITKFQGFYFAKPMKLNDLKKFIKENEWKKKSLTN